ncbi:MAG: hypothetical protein ACRCY8_19450 [Dermatophilaceae bacterium]
MRLVVDIPTIAVQPALLREAAAALAGGGTAAALEGEELPRTWVGLANFYQAPETPDLLTVLDPVRESTARHELRMTNVRRALDDFADEADAVIAQLDDARALVAGRPELEADVAGSVAAALARLAEAEAACAGAIRAELADGATGVAATVGDIGDGIGDFLHAKDAFVAWTLLLAGDATAGEGYLDSGFEKGLIWHFTEGTGEDYVLSAEELAPVSAAPAVHQVSAAIASGAVRGGSSIPLGDAGRPAPVRAVTLEGGRPGYAVPVDFRQPVEGGAVNPFDGSLGRAEVFFDESGRAVGIRDTFDFSNGGRPVDAVNLVGGLYGSRAFEVRGGIIEERPAPDPITQPDAGVAVGRIWEREVGGGDPGLWPPTPRMPGEGGGR